MTSTTFGALHAAPGGFIMPNAWDAGGAIVLAECGFDAIATTSAGIAFSMGRQDYAVTNPDLGVSREAMFERMAEIAQAVDIPVNGDLEAGWGDTPEAVAETIRMAIAAGLAGGNIEDKIPGENALYDESLAVERIIAAKEAAGPDFVLTARTDALFMPGGLEETIRRLNRFHQVGADLLYAPGVSALRDVEPLMGAVTGPLNVVIGLGTNAADAHGLIAAGVKRISLGGTIARAALGFVREAGLELLGRGTIGFCNAQISGGELNAMFARRLSAREVTS